MPLNQGLFSLQRLYLFKMSESFVFRGNRDQFQEWYDAIKIKFNRNGVNRVALNTHKYPPDYLQQYWADNNLAVPSPGEWEVMQNNRSKQQEEWHEKDEKAKATLHGRLDSTLREKYRALFDNSYCHAILHDLATNYGGALDSISVAYFQRETEKPLLESQSIEAWLVKLEQNSKKANIDIHNEVTMKALLERLLYKNERTRINLEYCDDLSLNYTDSKEYLIRKDRRKQRLVQDGKNVSIDISTIRNLRDTNLDERTLYYTKRNQYPNNSDRYERSRSKERNYKYHHDRDNNNYRAAYNNKCNSRERSRSREKSYKPCFDWKNNKCRRGSSCKFQHESHDNIKERTTDIIDKPTQFCFAWQKYGSCKKGSSCPYSHSKETIGNVRMLNNFSSTTNSSILQIDSGSDHTISNNLQSITNYVQFERPRYMTTISGSQLEVLGKGTMGQNLSSVYYAPEADMGVIAVKDIQEMNLLTYFPPGKGSGCCVIDPKTNEIILQSDSTYCVDIQSLLENKVRTVRSKLDLNEKKLEWIIPDAQRREGYPSLQVMMGKCRCTDDYPFTEEQIKKHYVQFHQHFEGHQQRSTFRKEGTSRTTPMTIGTDVSTDCMHFDGGESGIKHVQIFIDRFSGYVHAYFTPTSGDAETLAACVTRLKQDYKVHDHDIKNISQDSLKAYQAEDYENILLQEGINRRESAPYEHQQVLAERFIQTLSAIVISIKAGAKWAPSKLICFIIMLAVLLWNRQEGLITGVSREEQFTGQRPSAFKNGMAGAYGDCFIVNQSIQQNLGGKFSDHNTHGVEAMYLMPNQQSTDSHYFYNWNTSRVISRRSFTRVPGIPTKWQIGDNDKPGKVIAENGKVFDFINGPKSYDVTHVGATIQTTQSDKNQSNNNDFNNNTFQDDNIEMNVCDADTKNNIPLTDTNSVVHVNNMQMFDNPTAINDNISSRLRSSGESDGRSLKVRNNYITDIYQQNSTVPRSSNELSTIPR